MDLKNKVAVITGASAGLGLAFARKLVSRGSHVVGLARRQSRLEQVRSKLGERFTALPCDVTDEEQVQRAFADIAHQFGRVDALVNNAGLGRFGSLETLSSDNWSLQIDTNLTGVFFCTRAVIPMMRQQNAASGFGGHIVNIASIAGIIGSANISAYNTTKFGLRGMSEALMKELRSDGIKVSSVCPGSVRTDFGRHAGSSGAANPMEADDIADTVVHILEAPDNYLISEVVMRPLRPRG